MEITIRRLPEWVETDYDLELYHHGIKGQRWGVRRYQNEDGTLTPAGAKRLGRYQSKQIKFAERMYGNSAIKLQKKADKLTNKLNSTDKNLQPAKAKRLEKKRDKIQNRADYNKQHLDHAMDKIGNMTLEQVIQYQKQDSRERAKMIVSSMFLSPALVGAAYNSKHAYNKIDRIGGYDAVKADTDQDRKYSAYQRKLFGDIRKK